jgi:hypothetical protein
MSDDSVSKIKEAVEEWYKAKEKVAFYEKQSEKIKQQVIDYMKNKEVETLVTTNYIVSKKSMSRDTLSKKDVPDDLWKKYAKNISYDAYYIKEK